MKAITALALLAPVAAWAAPIQIVHQARLLDGDGTPLNGQKMLTIGIYADGSTSSFEWSEDITVSVDNGYASVILGADLVGNPLQDSVFDGSPRYLQVSIDALQLGPRQLIATVPQAVLATNVVGGTADVASAQVSGTLRLGTDTATCPDGASAGEIRWNTAGGVLQVCDGIDWRSLSTDAPGSCAEAKLLAPQATTGVFTLAPGGGSSLEVHCDMTVSPPKALMMRIAGNSSSHAQNNGRVGDYPCTPSSSGCKLSTAEISRFIAEPDVQVFEVDPDATGYLSFFQRAATDDLQWPTHLEADNRSVLAASTSWSWILTSYQTYANARDGVSGDTGDYADDNHYYPTPYADQQFFFRGSGTGIRSSTQWGPTGLQDNLSGVLWVR